MYGVTTGRLNEQVRRNIKRFPDDFMFRLTKDEFNLLISQIAISNTKKAEHAKCLMHLLNKVRQCYPLFIEAIERFKLTFK